MEKSVDFAGISREFSGQTWPESKKTADFGVIFRANFARNRLVLR